LHPAITINCTVLLLLASGMQRRLKQNCSFQADKLVGGSDAVLVIDDAAMPKKGKHSVGVAPQYVSALMNHWDRLCVYLDDGRVGWTTTLLRI